MDIDSTNFQVLQALSYNGFDKLKLLKTDSLYQTYQQRLKYELDIIEELGFTDYILLVWDIINFCIQQDIATGLGRGSAAGSLVCYFVGITQIDPIKYDLFFERFISKTRAKKKIIDGIIYLDGNLAPDIDCDISYEDRYKVIEYLHKKHKGKTAKILTINTLSGRLLIKECGKIVGKKSESEMNEISDLIPKLFGTVKDIEKAYGEVADFKKWCDNNQDVYQIALKLRDLNKNFGAHASGYAISFEDIEDTTPLQLSSDKELISGYDMYWLSTICLKVDLLGLRSASLVHGVCKSVNIKINEIDLNDSFIYERLQDLKSPHGLFQIEAHTNFRVCQKVKPRNLEQLSGVLALARPGALDFTDQYAEYTNNNTFQSIHPFFDNILRKTGGICLFQEQLMKMIHQIGFTLDEAETIRRIIGKKKIHEMVEWESKIKEKVKENNLDPQIGEILWKIANDSAN